MLMLRLLKAFTSLLKPSVSILSMFRSVWISSPKSSLSFWTHRGWVCGVCDSRYQWQPNFITTRPNYCDVMPLCFLPSPNSWLLLLYPLFLSLHILFSPLLPFSLVTAFLLSVFVMLPLSPPPPPLSCSAGGHWVYTEECEDETAEFCQRVSAPLTLVWICVSY